MPALSAVSTTREVRVARHELTISHSQTPAPAASDSARRDRAVSVDAVRQVMTLASRCTATPILLNDGSPRALPCGVEKLHGPVNGETPGALVVRIAHPEAAPTALTKIGSGGPLTINDTVAPRRRGTALR